MELFQIFYDSRDGANEPLRADEFEPRDRVMLWSYYPSLHISVVFCYLFFFFFFFFLCVTWLQLYITSGIFSPQYLN